jgi:hypothetical protein
MHVLQRIAIGGLLLTLMGLSTGCVVHDRGGPGYHEGYREGYYDREHSRYYHGKTWHSCEEHDEHCR